MRLKENEIIEQLKSNIEKYAPLAIKSIEREVVFANGRADALIEFCIDDGPCFKALVEFPSVATPRMIFVTSELIKGYLNNIADKTIVPVVIVTYMGEEQAKILQREGVSWIDLCGNMTIRAPGGIYIERTGKKNLYPDTSPIKKIYEGTSSLVSRALLLKKEPFKTLYEIVNFINERNGNITLATVSKVINSLEENLLVTKADSGISAANREKLLEKLAEGYRTYSERYENEIYTYAFDTGFDISFFWSVKVDFTACGFYAAKLKGLATTDRITIFIKSINEAKDTFERSIARIRPDAEFGQLDLIETRNPCVWFNMQSKQYKNIVDDLELYLEMMIDTPRGQKVAEMLKERILQGQV
jgi:hypothetical protein